MRTTAQGGSVGGLVGEASGLVQSSFSSGLVQTLHPSAGGLIGFARGGSSSVIGCVATGPVLSTSSQVGGLVGYLETGSVSRSAAVGDVAGADDVGGLVGALASSASLLAEALVEVGELDEALHWTAIAEKHAAADDLDAQMQWRPVRAIVHARRGELAAAEPVAREAGTLAGRSDNLNRQAKARLTLAEVLRLQGREQDARAHLDHAADLYKRKEIAVGAAHVRQIQRQLTPT